MLPIILSVLPYCALILLVAVPGAQWQPFTLRMAAKVDYAALFCALVATLCLPWSGVGLLPFHTGLFYPFFGFSLLLNVHRSRPRFQRTLFFLLLFASFVVLADRLSLKIGVPGDRFSIENAGMILRLSSIRNVKLIIAMFGCFVLLGGAFLAVYRNDAAGNVGAFAFTSFLAFVFLPIDTTSLFNLFPPTSIVLDFLLLFLAAIVLQQAIRHLATRSRVYETTYRS